MARKSGRSGSAGDAGKTDASALTLDDIKANWDVEGAKAPFKPISKKGVSYRCMSKSESDYYFYWRSMARKGFFLKASKNILHLFTSEIINASKKKSDLDLLVKAVRTYDGIDDELLDSMADACFAFARINKLPYPSLDRAGDEVCRDYLMGAALASDPIGDAPVRTVMRFLIGFERGCVDMKLPYDALYGECLRRIDSYEAGVRGKRLAEYLPDVEHLEFDAYKGFAYFGRRVHASLDAAPVFRDGEVALFLLNTFKCLVKSVRDADGLEASAPIGYPPSYRRLVQSAVDDWREGSWKPRDPVQNAFELDPSMVKSARDDLDVVTGLMYADDDALAAVKAQEAGTASSGDSWIDFASSLDDECAGYIKEILNGDAEGYLKSIGARMKAMDDRVNSIAMDSVGDVVLEKGRMIEDYIDDMKRAILWRGSRYRRGL